MKRLSRMTKRELIQRIKMLAAGCGTASTPSNELRAAEVALRDSMERLQAILNAAFEGIITIDGHGIVESMNPAAQKMFGYKASEVVGRNVNALMPSPYSEDHDHYLATYARTGWAKIIGNGRAVVGRRKDGTVFPMDLSVAEVKLASSRVFTGFVRDVTKRQEAEEASRRNEALLAKAQEIAHIGSYEIEVAPSGTCRWSPEVFRILGLVSLGKELTTDDYIRRMVHPEDRQRVRAAVDKAICDGGSYHEEYRIVRPDGAIRYLHSVAEPVIGPNETVIKMVGTLQDITERKELEKEILEISEREQSRIGQDLHDGLCQHLAGIEFRLRSLQERLAAKSKPEAAEAAGLAKLVREGIEQTRTLAHGLSPVMLPEDSLMSALAELATSTEKAFRISCSFNCPSPVLIRNNAVATHLYRIAQEAVHNAVRHGRAKFIVISLLAAGGRLVAGVKDDGIGLPKVPGKHKGMGLRVMQYRASMIGGSLIVQREPEGGTSVVCSLRMNSGEDKKSKARQDAK
jgi:PAS domain S-box-containing protein